MFAVHVRESDAKPVQCSDDFFWRQGAVPQKLSRDEIRDFSRVLVSPPRVVVWLTTVTASSVLSAR